ncbi:hypothetical protein IJG91_02980 [Candidatus Saccharibacteria bacterium]|nr:hypothetical protein [Candidatus Saccharibacteria bacterium]
MFRKKKATANKKAKAISKKAEPKLTKAEAELKKAKAKKIKAEPKKILAKTKRRKPQAVKFSEEALKRDILKEAKVLKISNETAGKYAKIVSGRVAAWVSKRATVTQPDIDVQVAKEIKKYNKDLAFIYENKGKII